MWSGLTGETYAASLGCVPSSGAAGEEAAKRRERLAQAHSSMPYGLLDTGRVSRFAPWATVCVPLQDCCCLRCTSRQPSAERFFQGGGDRQSDILAPGVGGDLYADREACR